MFVVFLVQGTESMRGMLSQLSNIPGTVENYVFFKFCFAFGQEVTVSPITQAFTR